VYASVNGRPQIFRAEQILLALGRQPNTDDLELNAVSVQTTTSGNIVVDDHMRTTCADIYAAGDCTTLPRFVYVAAAGGSLAAENALLGENRRLDLSAMPAVVFTDPQVATVGLTEAQARQRKINVKTSLLPLTAVPRALAARDTRGLIKLIANTENDHLLGAHILAAEAGEVVQTAALAVKFGLRVQDLRKTLFPYLTQVEGLKLAALTFEKDIAKLSCCAG
jgi:mercuric reductase